jgi:MerR family mercuric resistance operon transcriptional regulator
MDDASYSIADLADAAGVGVETVRYYERRGLVAQPARPGGGYRRYGGGHVHRIRFIKRAQDIGFTLEEIDSLLALEDGTDRRSIRRIAAARLEETRRRITDLRRIERVLAHLLHECAEHAGAPRCPIIAAIGSGTGAYAAGARKRERHALPSASRNLRTTA